MPTIQTDVIHDGFGVKLPPCALGGIRITPQQQMSKNAGRNALTGLFTGDVVNIKFVVNLSWNRLSEEQFNIIDECFNNCISDHRITMRLRPSEGYRQRSYYVAAGSYNYSVQVQMGDKVYYEGVTVQLIER